MPMKATYEYLKAQDVYNIMNVIENHRIHHVQDDDEDTNLEHIYCLTHKVEFFVNIENSNREVWLCRDNKYGNEKRSCLRHFYVE